MGACENTCEAHEPSLHCAAAAAAIEQHSCWGIKDSEQLPCLETSCNPIDSNVDPTGEIDANDGSASLNNVVEDVLVGKGIGLVGQSENAVGTIAGKLLEDECGVSGACWNVRQSEVDDCNGEMGRLCDEEVRFGGLNEGWVNCESSLVESVTVSGPLATCGQQDGQTNDKNAGAQGLMEEKKDVLVAIETDFCDQLATSTFCEMSAELIPVNDMARNGDRQDDEDHESGSGEGVMEEKIDGLDGTGTVNCDETVLSPSCEMHAKLIQVNDLCRNCNQQDDQKDDKSGSVQGVMEGNCDGLASRLADNCNEILLSSSCDMPAELILTNGFSSDGTELHNHDYKTSQQVVGEERNSDLTAVLEISDVHAVMEWKSDGFMEKEYMDTCEKTLPSLGDGMTSESLPANCLSRNGVEQDKQGGSTSMVVAMEEKSNDLSGIENSRIEGIVQEKSNGLATIETDTCDDICPSLGCEIPAGLIPVDGSPRNGVEQDEQDNCTSPMVVTEEKSVHLTVLVSDNHRQVLPSLGHQVLSGVTTVTCLSRKGVQQDDQMGDQLISCLSSKPVNSPFHKGAIEVEEKKHDLLARVETDIDNQIWNVEMHSESVPFSGLLNGFSQQSKLDTKVISSLTETVLGLESNMSASIGTDMCTQISPHGAIDSSSAVDCSGQTDNEGKDHVGIDCVSKARCHGIVSSSRRSTGEHKSSRKTQTKRAARKRRNTTKVQNLSGGVETIFKTVTKKRSCSSKLARSSVWGSLGNVTQTFKLINGLELDEIKNHGSENAKVGQGIGKRNVIRAAGRSRRSSRKDCALASRIRLKVKVGKEVCQTESNQKIMLPEEIYSTAPVDLISDYGTESYEGTSFDMSKLANGTEDKAVEECTQKDLHSSTNKQEKGKACCDPSVKDANLASKDMEGAVISNKSSCDAAEDYLGVRSHTEVEALGVAIGKRYTDPGTSPDSEVINSVPEGQAGARCPEDFSDALLTSSKAFAADEVAGSRRRGNKKESLLHAGNYVLEDGSLAATSINKVKAAKKRRSKERKGDCFSSSEILTSTSAIGLGNSSSKSNGVNEGRSKDSARRQKVNGCRERGNDRKSVNKNKGKEKKSVRDHVVYKGEDDPSSVADDSGKTISGDDTTKEEVANLDMVSSDVMEQNLSPDNAWVRCDDCLKWRHIPVGLVESISQTHCQWMCKDNTDKTFADCSIPQEKSNAEINAELGISDADEDPYDVPSNYTELECIRTLVSKEHEFTRITTNQFLHRSRKTQSIDEIMVCHCKLPPDGRLGCGDECLNRMLNIECVQGTCPCGDLCSNQQFQKRNYAKMLWDRCGKKGFGLRLEEDMSRGQFLIEYVGQVLDVHAYEARQKEYASKGHKHFYFMTLDGSEVIDACAKGNLGRFINHSCDPNCRTEKWVVNGEICIGLFALRDIKKGEEVTFDYNYVRVVGAAAKKCYCGTPQCQGYIGGDPTNTEVIDHVDSDEEFPEPVMLEDGEAGGSLKNTISKTSFFGISNDKDKMDSPKTAVKSEDLTEIEDPMNQSTPSTCQSPTALRMNNLPVDFLSSSQPIEISPRAKDVTSKATSAVQQEISMEETKSKSQKLKTSPSSMLTKPSTDERKPKSATAENKRVFVKSRFIIKTSHHSSFIKKGKSTTSPINVNKVQLIPNKHQEPSMKPKKLMESTSNGHFEAVQEKLNELLDSEGGISKRKDAPRGYLKLLLLTAASGASRNGEAIQSNRELSMILDALLKTRSRVVLMDVISKNGLRMLHNMMKQYRRDFKKIPILRKLLKVLEYLAVREILTLEHINGGPPCPGMESFRVSMLSLTEHDDKQVHQIARKFRDKWIPRQARKFSYMDRDDGRAEFQRVSKCNRVPASHNHWHDHVVGYTEASSCVMESNLATTSAGTTVNESTTAPCVGSGTRTRKRKSRWDQPADGNTALGLLQHNEQKMESGLLEQSESNSLPDISKEVLDHADKADGEYNYCPHCVRYYCQQDETSSVDDGRENTHEDVPPGFSPPVIPVPVSSRASSTATELPQQDVCHLNCPVDAVDGFPQSKFISRLPVSYGIPLPIVQRFGSSLTETVESWVVAPGMPFHPFPPLPPLPSFKKEAASSCAVNSMEIDGIPYPGQQDCHDTTTCLKENNPSTTGADQPDMDGPGTNDHQTFKRAKVSSYDLGRRYFRQQKWNRVPPPWVRNRNGWGCIGDNSRGGVCSTEGGNLTIEHRNSYC